MTETIQNSQPEEILNLAIFVIISHKRKEFFVWKTKSERLKATYKYHYYLENKKTKELFEKEKSLGEAPPMFLLSEPKTTQRQAFLHCIAWTRFFQDQGYTSLSGEGLTNYTDDLRDEALEIYNRIKHKTLDAVCQPEGGLYPDFGQISPRNKTPNKDYIKFRVKEDEYENIKKAADNAGMSISQYCKQAALKGKPVIIDRDVFRAMDDCTEKYIERNRLLKQIMHEIKNRCVFYPVDLEIIQNAIKENKKQQIEENNITGDILKILRG